MTEKGEKPDSGCFSEKSVDECVSNDCPSTDRLRPFPFKKGFGRLNMCPDACNENFDSILSLPGDGFGFEFLVSGMFERVLRSVGFGITAR